ncbi:Hypothetical predicted protein [Mytilus galloprovincialis]|uniref:C-type lectin domain-containing protein n=1 Tax=Mytilus galloprovincialis TaxID=29158 RepID=A0A8B6DD63_MYTGA|nr:Hypothetical predicted protein [Mytilus galloprovincialis]
MKVKELFTKPLEEFYVGYSRDTSNNLVTLDGRHQSWAPWNSGQPSGATGASCVTSFNLDGTFWEEYCTDKYYAICQWPAYFAKFWNPTTINEATTEKHSTTATIETFTSEETTETSIPVTTAHNLGTTTDRSCRCNCKTVKVKVNSTISVELKAEIAANISKELSVNVETLSSTIRSKTSAKDDRPSSASIGYVGVILLVIVFGGLMILDLPVFWIDLKLRLNNLKCCQKSKRIQC